MSYDPERSAAFYDEYGEREWTRFEDGRTSPVSLEIHKHYLRRFVNPGDRVLDAGAGPGRFTIELARIGASIVVADLSQAQLDLNRRKVAEAGLEDALLDHVLADILDLPFDDGSFDAVVCYGGPLSYLLDRSADGLAELLRVTRPGGHLAFSVMSLAGSFATGLRVLLTFDTKDNDEVIRTGHLPSALSAGHLDMRLFRFREIEEIVSRLPASIVAASASNLNTAAESETWPTLDDAARDALVAWELDLSAEPGAVDAGPHVVVVLRKNE